MPLIYLTTTDPTIHFELIAEAGDVIGTKPDGSDYRYAGIPDGLGAFDNDDGTFTVLNNHELGNGVGLVREHGSTGAFVSRLVIDKATLSVLSAEDAIKSVILYDEVQHDFVAGTATFHRFCSSDLADVTAFFNPVSGLGTEVRIYLTGEETSGGRAIALVASGSEQGIAYELGYLGNLAFENLIASADSGDKTVVVSTDDTGGGQLFVYVGEKNDTGANAVERAGLVGGSLYGIKVAGVPSEANAAPVSGTFTLQEMGIGGDVSDMDGAQLDTESVAEGVTGWLRPEDGQFDPTNPNVFYFTTTNSFDANSRLYKLTFSDITDPLAGGTVEALLTGDEGHKMLDNITVADSGIIYMQEDPGGNDRLAKVWAYDPATDVLQEIAEHNAAIFGPGAPGLLTTNEESSGIIDVTGILGDGDTQVFLLDSQAHTNAGDPELVEPGQLLAMFIDDPVLNGGNGKDHLVGTFANEILNGGNGKDLLEGGSGDDELNGGNGKDILIGGAGSDCLLGGSANDWFIFDNTGETGTDQIKDFSFGDLILLTVELDEPVVVLDNETLDLSRLSSVEIDGAAALALDGMVEYDGSSYFAYSLANVLTLG